LTGATINTKNLTCRYAGTTRDAIAGINLSVEDGGTVALLGPNGGGKTTLFRVLSTLLPPTSGSVSISGHDVVTERDEVRKRVGIVFQSPALDRELTAFENLAYHGRLLGLSKREAAHAARMWLERLDLLDVEKHLAKRLSGGMRRRLEIGRALLRTPSLLLLDEPTVGLDPSARRHVWDLIRQLRDEADREVTLVVTTHLMDDVGAGGAEADRVVLLDLGRVVADDAPERLRQAAGGEVLRLTPERSSDREPLQKWLRERLGLQSVAWDDTLQVHLPDAKSALRQLLDADLTIPLREAAASVASLEDVFLQQTGRRLDGETEAVT
jgi:ABC-2 type transport system ATP-binding protein